MRWGTSSCINIFLIWMVETDGTVVATVDVIHITHAAVATASQVCFL